MSAEVVNVRQIEFDEGRRYVIVNAGKKTTERIVPPAGEHHAFNVDRWTHTIEVYVSRTGRSVRVFIDGAEAAAPTGGEE